MECSMSPLSIVKCPITGPLAASLSALSFPRTPACPGQYIHTSSRKCELPMYSIHSYLNHPFWILRIMDRESNTITTRTVIVSETHFNAAEIASICILILEVVVLYAPHLSMIVCPLNIAEKPQPDLNPLCTDPSVYMITSSSVELSAMS